MNIIKSVPVFLTSICFLFSNQSFATDSYMNIDTKIVHEFKLFVSFNENVPDSERVLFYIFSPFEIGSGQLKEDGAFTLLKEKYVSLAKKTKYDDYTFDLSLVISGEYDNTTQAASLFLNTQEIYETASGDKAYIHTSLINDPDNNQILKKPDKLNFTSSLNIGFSTPNNEPIYIPIYIPIALGMGYNSQKMHDWYIGLSHKDINSDSFGCIHDVKNRIYNTEVNWIFGSCSALKDFMPFKMELHTIASDKYLGIASLHIWH